MAPPRSDFPLLLKKPFPTEYTWQEVAQHNTAASAWVIVHGKVYDITDFLPKHPGGREMLLLSAGRECTDLFECYHAFTDKAEKYLSAYEIGVAVGPPEFTPFPKDNGFWDTLKRRVSDHFVRTGQNPKSAVGGTLRMVPVMLLFIATWLVMNRQILPDESFIVRVIAAVIFGVCQVLTLLHVMHDASHTAIGSSEGWWKFYGRATMDWLAGSSMMSWHHQHIVGHHVYTNVFLQDPDLPHGVTGDFRRLVSRQAWAAVYSWQHLYLPLLYGLLALKVRVDDFTVTWFARLSGHVRVNHYDPMLVRIVLVKAVWAAWRIGVPLLVWQGVSAAEYWTLFLIAEMASGYWLAWNFQVSHVTTDVSWPLPTPSPPAMGGDSEPLSQGPGSMVLPESWAVTQVKTGLDYAHGNTLMTFLCGALNYQIEHHLFPGVSQYYYPEIAPIVRATCAEFGLPYRYEPSFFAAFGAHLSHLKELGQKGVAAPAFD